MNLQCRHDGLGVNSSAYKIFERNISNTAENDIEKAIRWAPKNNYYQEADNLGHVSYPIDNFWNTEDGKCYETSMNWDGFKDAVIIKRLTILKPFLLALYVQMLILVNLLILVGVDIKLMLIKMFQFKRCYRECSI